MRVPEIVLGMLLAIAVFAMGTTFAPQILAQSQNPSPRDRELVGKDQPPPKNDAQKTPDDQRGTDKSPFIVKIQNPTKTQREAEQEPEYQYRKAADERIIHLTKIGIIVGALQTVALFITFFVIAFVGVRQLRAYVFTELDESDHPTFKPGSEVIIPIRARNRGQTPAYRVSQWVDIEIFPEPFTGEFPTPVITTPTSFLDLGPTGQFLIMAQIARPLTGDELAGLQNGTMRIYVFGEIRYRDAFAFRRGSRQPRFTKFRYQVHHAPNGAPIGLLASPEGNHAN
jgi:hypothetical protein